MTQSMETQTMLPAQHEDVEDKRKACPVRAWAEQHKTLLIVCFGVLLLLMPQTAHARQEIVIGSHFKTEGNGGMNHMSGSCFHRIPGVRIGNKIDIPVTHESAVVKLFEFG